MGLFDKNPDRTPVDRGHALGSIPVLNPGVRMEDEEDGKRLLTVPLRRRSRGFLARFQPEILEKRVRLDELGAFVVDQINGTRTVREIVDAFVRRFGTNRREAELCTGQFLKSLAERHVISIGVP